MTMMFCIYVILQQILFLIFVFGIVIGLCKIFKRKITNNNNKIGKLEIIINNKINNKLTITTNSYKFFYKTINKIYTKHKPLELSLCLYDMEKHTKDTIISLYRLYKNHKIINPNINVNITDLCLQKNNELHNIKTNLKYITDNVYLNSNIITKNEKISYIINIYNINDTYRINGSINKPLAYLILSYNSYLSEEDLLNILNETKNTIKPLLNII